mmetsp:Transcript_37012/g.93335  ORF Transcript_37012/g.93335 Transcript_37012/m.93335 type:complete len:232 (+) Transcript_37012:540-1235(+)
MQQTPTNRQDQPHACSRLCSSSRSSRPDHLVSPGQPADRGSGRSQHCAVRGRVHAAEAGQHHQHLGGRSGGRHPAPHGLGCSIRAAGAGRRRAGRGPVLLADASLHGSGLDVQGGLHAGRLQDAVLSRSHRQAHRHGGAAARAVPRAAGLGRVPDGSDQRGVCLRGSWAGSHAGDPLGRVHRAAVAAGGQEAVQGLPAVPAPGHAGPGGAPPAQRPHAGRGRSAAAGGGAV